MTNQTHHLISDPQSEGFNAKHGHGGRGYQSGQQGRGHYHGYSQNRRWHQQHRQLGQRNAKDTDSMKEDENEYKTLRATDNTREDNNKNGGKQEKTEGGKVSLLQSSKERLRGRLKEKVSQIWPSSCICSTLWAEIEMYTLLPKVNLIGLAFGSRNVWEREYCPTSSACMSSCRQMTHLSLDRKRFPWQCQGLSITAWTSCWRS